MTQEPYASIIYDMGQYCLKKQREGKEQVPYYWFEKLAKATSDDARIRRKIVKKMQYYRAYAPAGDSEPLTCQMILQADKYDAYMVQAEDDAVDEITAVANEYLASQEIGDAHFERAIRAMRDCLNNTTNSDGEIVFGYHNEKGENGENPGCFALLEINGNDQYVSLSGKYDAKDIDIIRYLKMDKRWCDAFNAKIDNILMQGQFHAATYARIKKVTKRYPYLGGPSIPSPSEKLVDAMNRKVNPDEMVAGYSCCERKLFAKAVPTSSMRGMLFVRYKPCKKCVPAVKEWNSITGDDIVIWYIDATTDSLVRRFGSKL